MPIIDIILPVFILIGLGFFATRFGFFSEDVINALATFTQNFAIPCLLFRAISEIDIHTSISAPLIISYYVGAFSSFFAGYLGARIFFRRERADAVAIGFCCLFSNTILLGLPITERAYGPEILSYNFWIIAFHAPLCYLLGVTAMETARNHAAPFREKSRRVLRVMFRNPFVIAIALGFVVNFSNLPIPSPLISSLDLIARSALPMALFALGGILVGYRLEGDMKTIIMIGGISLILHPLIVMSVGKAFVLDQDALRAAVLTASMAPGVNVYVFANMYGAARRVAAAAVLGATAASMVTVLMWIHILG